MPDNDTPVHIGSLEQTGTVETDDGPMLELVTDQGTFLLSAESKSGLDALSMSVDIYLDKLMLES